MKRLYSIFITVFASFLVFFACADNVRASVSDFGLKPLYGNNQIEKNGQVDVYGEPGSQQKVGITIFNKDTKSHSYKVTVNTAYTTSNGQFTFSKGNASDPSLNLKLKQFISPKNQIINVEGNGIKDVYFSLTIPKQIYTGYLMGGFVVTPAKGEKVPKSLTSNGTLLSNKFEIGIPLKVRQNKDIKKQPNFKIRQVTPFGISALKQRGVYVNLQNYVKGFNPAINATAVITKRSGDSGFKKISKLKNISPAPNSNFNYEVDWGKTPLQAGDYHAKIKLVAVDKAKSWVVDKDFSISNADAAKYNKLSGIKPNYMWLWILIAILILLLVLGLGIYFGRRKQNKQ